MRFTDVNMIDQTMGFSFAILKSYVVYLRIIELLNVE